MPLTVDDLIDKLIIYRAAGYGYLPVETWTGDARDGQDRVKDIDIGEGAVVLTLDVPIDTWGL